MTRPPSACSRRIPRSRQAAALLPGDRHQPRAAGGSDRPAAGAAHPLHGHRQDCGRVPDRWKLWTAGWNKRGDFRKPKILFLADRNILVDDPKDKTFAPFGDARFKIENGEISHGREMYFAIYQAIASDERRPGLYREYAPDFFDLIIVDECHRGSARDESNWREILEYFEPAYQLGMTATPLREDNRDTYLYFGEPALHLQLWRRASTDGFLAPYRVHRVVTDYDAAGWRPSKGELDRYGREIPDDEYHTKDFERVVALRARTEAIARHLTDFLAQTDRFAKTIVFCVDQEHAERDAAGARQPQRRSRCGISGLRLPRDGRRGRHRQGQPQPVPGRRDEGPGHPDDVAAAHHRRRRADLQERRAGARGRLDDGVQADHRPRDAGPRRLRQAVLQHPRLHRHRHRKFADPDFDGEPTAETITEIDAEGEIVTTQEEENPAPEAPDEIETEADGGLAPDEEPGEPRKLYVDGGTVEVVAHLVYELSRGSNKLVDVEDR